MDDSSAWEVGGSGLGSVVRSCDRFARYNLSPRLRLLFPIKVQLRSSFQPSFPSYLSVIIISNIFVKNNPITFISNNLLVNFFSNILFLYIQKIYNVMNIERTEPRLNITQQKFSFTQSFLSKRVPFHRVRGVTR